VAAELHPFAQREARDERAILVPIERIQPNPDQPRRSFDERGLEELAGSIREHGILQPLVLLQSGETYTIIAGERRYRAAQLAGLKDVPARLHDNPKTAREVQLVENLQREDLGLLEEARALAELRNSLDASIRDLEEATGKSKSYIARRLKVLDMPQDVQEILEREPRLLSQAEGISKIADPKRRTARIKALLNKTGDEVKVKPARQGRPAHAVSFKNRKGGAFDLVIKYRPGQTDREQIIIKLREVLAELEARSEEK
jgi:ParB family transcriptional regulator, chromosome partitioning protein